MDKITDRALLFIFLIILSSFCLVGSAPIELDFHKKSRNNISPLNSSINSNYNNLIYQEVINLNNLDNDQMIVNLCLGTPVQCFDVLVDSGSFYLWVTDAYASNSETSDAKNKFNYKKSSTFENSYTPYKLTYGTGSAEGVISSDKLSLGNLKLDKLNFILVNKEEGHSGTDGIVGLGYYYENFEQDAIKFSILDQLKENGLIKKQLFTQKYTGNKEGKMYIGELPEEIQNDMENYSTCPALKINSESGGLNPRWECNLRGIFYGYDNVSENAAKIDQPALFDTGTNTMLAPFSFLEKLKDTYFKDLIESGQCKWGSSDGGFFSYICSPNASVLFLPEFNFIFGEWVIKMYPIEMFFLGPDQKVHFMFSANENLDRWIMGEPMLKKFHFVFDKDSDEIGFYGSKDKFKSNMPFPNPYVWLIVIGIILLCILVISLVAWGIYYLIKKRKSKVTYYSPSMYFNQNANTKGNNNLL